MIFGVGTDIVQVSRMEENLAKHGDRFAERILTESEMTRYSTHVKPAQFLAKRFAAKEAAAKAFGMAAQLAEQNQINCTHLSLSDEPNYAIAFVILECSIS